MIIGRIEQGACERYRFREDVTWCGAVLSTVVACTELTCGFEQVQIVGPDKELSKVDNCCSQTLFTVVVVSVFGDISNQLGNLEDII